MKHTFWTLFVLTLFGCSKENKDILCPEFMDKIYINEERSYQFIHIKSDNTIEWEDFFIHIKDEYTTTDCITIKMKWDNSPIRILQVTSKSIRFKYSGKEFIYVKK